MRLRPTQWLIGILILLLIFYPDFHCNRKVSPFGIVLFDRSESMKGAPEPDINSPLPLKTLEFGGNKPGTAIGEGLLTARDCYEEASFILLYSDGANTQGVNPIKAGAEVGIPVYIICPDFTPEISGYISVFGPEGIEEGDSAVYKVHYRTPHPSVVRISEGEVQREKEVRGEGVISFAMSPGVGMHTLEFNLYRENESIARTERGLYVKKRPRILIYTGKLDWNYKFFYRFFKSLGYEVIGTWKKEQLKDSFSSFEIVCLINPKRFVEEKLGLYVSNGGRVIIVNSSLRAADFLPLIAPQVTSYSKELHSKELPIHYYSKPSAIRRGSESINIMNEKIVYIMEYGKGRVAQFACLDPWRLQLVGKGVYQRDMFGEVMSNLLRFLLPPHLSVTYPDRLIEGEDLRMVFTPTIPDSFLWDGHHRAIFKDTIVIPNPEVGVHHFQAVFPSTTLIGSLSVEAREEDRKDIDTTMLSAIASISGGGKWEDDFDQSHFGYKEKELYINLRHNWFFFGIFFLVLFYDWYLWMKGK